MAVEDIFVRVLRVQRVVAIVKLHLLNNFTYILTCYRMAHTAQCSCSGDEPLMNLCNLKI